MGDNVTPSGVKKAPAPAAGTTQLTPAPSPALPDIAPLSATAAFPVELAAPTPPGAPGGAAHKLLGEEDGPTRIRPERPAIEIWVRIGVLGDLH